MEMQQRNNLIFETGSQTNTGLKKEFNQNEVSHLTTINGDLWIIANGINGTEGGGALSAKIAIKSINDYFKTKKYTNPLNALNNSILFANHQIFAHSEKNAHLNGMACTLAVLLHRDNKIYYAYAGSCKIFVFRNEKFQAITKDHSLVQQLIDKGKLKPEDAKKHPKKDEIYNLLGLNKDFKFSTCKSPIAAADGDVYVLTTPGVTNQLSDKELAEIVKLEDVSAEHKAIQIIEKANENGGDDNVSVQVLSFVKKDTAHKIIENKSKIKTRKNIKPLHFVLPLLFVLLCLSGYFIYDNFGSIKKALKSKTIKEEAVSQVINEDVVEYDSIDTEMLNENTQKDVDQDSETEINTEKGNIQKETSEEVNYDNTIITHIIKSGENLYRIGIRFCVTVQELEQLNNIQAKKIRLNQKIKIPVKAVHIVQKGDVLSLIAEKYHCKEAKIRRANALENEQIQVGNELYIPKEYK